MSDELLPTPRGQDSYERRNRKTQERIRDEGGDMTLPTFVETSLPTSRYAKEPLLPTPTSGDASASGHRQEERTPTSHEGTTLSDWATSPWARTSPCSPASEDSTSPSKPSASDASDRSSGTSPVQGSLLDIGPMSHGGEMSPRYVLPTPRASEGDRMARYKQGGHPLSSVVDSLASPSPTLVNDAARPTTAGSGRSSPASFAILNPDGSWSRTYPDSSQQESLGGPLSVTFSVTWPRSGSMRGGQVFEHPMSALPTDGSGSSSLLQTPSMADGLGGHLSRGGDRSDELLLKGQVKALLPTPRVEGFDAGNHRGQPDSLNQTIRYLPTPVSDHSRGLAQPGTDYQRLPNTVLSLGDPTNPRSEGGSE